MITFLITSHAILGAISLISGAGALIAKKGGYFHRKAGLLFFFSLLLAVCISVVITLFPGHYNPFLLSIGLFSAYLITTGFRAISFRTVINVAFIDKLLPVLMLIVGMSMIVFPIVVSGKINIVLTAFGTIGFILAINDIRTIRNIEKLRKSWLRLHLTKMISGFIASVTAFLVVNQFLTPMISWFLPTVLGSLYITAWNFKLNKIEKR